MFLLIPEAGLRVKHSVRRGVFVRVARQVPNRNGYILARNIPALSVGKVHQPINAAKNRPDMTEVTVWLTGLSKVNKEQPHLPGFTIFQPVVLNYMPGGLFVEKILSLQAVNAVNPVSGSAGILSLPGFQPVTNRADKFSISTSHELQIDGKYRNLSLFSISYKLSNNTLLSRAKQHAAPFGARLGEE